MSETVGDFLLGRLAGEWGVKRIYGYPGDGINGIIGAFEREGPRPELIQVRHEEMAAFMACAHAKFSGEAGVCLATSGPGAIHLLNGLYDAKLDHQPVVAIVGQQARAGLGGNRQQEVDLQTLFKDVASEYVQMASEPSQVRHLVDRAMRIALSERTVTCVIVPNDLQEEEAVPSPPHAHGTVHSGPGYERPEVVPALAQLERAAAALNAGEKVAMLVGAGAIGAAEEVTAVADQLGAGVAKALLGKSALPDDLSWVTGSIGLLGTEPSWLLMQGCDTLLMVGSSFPYSEFLPEEGQARGVQIDIDGRMVGIRYPMEVNLVGDAATTLRALLPLLERKQDRSWRETVESYVAAWWRTIEDRAQQPADPINPQLVFHELSARLPAGAIVTSDSGSAANWYARDLKFREGNAGSLSGTLATMGCGVPYAIAAKFAHPERPVIALVGDGAMQMNGLAELITVAKYRGRWPDQRLVVMVLNNRDLNQVTWEQRAMNGDPKFVGSQSIPDVPYARWAEMLGLRGVPRRAPRARRPRLGGGARRRPPRRPRRPHRPRGAAAAAPHHPRTGEGVRLGAAQGRSLGAADDRPVAAPEAAGSYPGAMSGPRRRHLPGLDPLRLPFRAHSARKGNLTLGAPRGLGARALRNLRRGRVQRGLAAVTAASALPLGLEIYFEHFRGSFGDKWMWTPVLLSPALAAAGLAAVRSERAARTWLPALSALYCLDGLIGVYTHVQGVRRRPGGFAEPLYNIVMGPPLLAPGSLALVGGMGLVAAAARRER